MSGHNKWTQIKRQKGKTDAEKSKVFGKFAKLIADEARKAGGNRNSPGLKTAIERAKAENMPNDNIERAVKRATESKTAMESIMYEAYGPGGVALLVEVLTDSRNRASNELKFIFSEHGGNLASPGAAAWAFEKSPEGWKATTTVPLSAEDLAKLEKLTDALEANEDVQAVFVNAE